MEEGAALEDLECRRLLYRLWEPPENLYSILGLEVKKWRQHFFVLLAWGWSRS